MKVLSLMREGARSGGTPYAGLLLGLILLAWPMLQRMLQWSDAAGGALDPNIWLLILMSVVVFLLLLCLCWGLLRRYWQAWGLPDMEMMVVQFNSLESWQQLKFFYGVFALLLLAGVGCFLAVL